MNDYQHALRQLQQKELAYPCTCSRKDIAAANRAPHAEDEDEPIYPGTCRVRSPLPAPARRCCWRFRVPDNARVNFVDGYFGPQTFVAGKDFGDFVLWRADETPGYQLACVVDDAAMRITEVVRGADLLKSTARQLLLYQALNLLAPKFYHCPLVTDAAGNRLAKRHDSLSLRALRSAGHTPEALRRDW